MRAAILNKLSKL